MMKLFLIGLALIMASLVMGAITAVHLLPMGWYPWGQPINGTGANSTSTAPWGSPPSFEVRIWTVVFFAGFLLTLAGYATMSYQGPGGII